MVCTPEQSRLNGAKSNGPTTPRGKAIAAQNATKHGLLATQPPMVQGEDQQLFYELWQSLVGEYQPQTPTEQLLVQQAAVGWWRLYRLWGVEAAIANCQLLPPDPYPERQPCEAEHWQTLAFGPKTIHHPEHRTQERQLLEQIQATLTVESLPQQRSQRFQAEWQAWQQTMRPQITAWLQHYHRLLGPAGRPPFDSEAGAIAPVAAGSPWDCLWHLQTMGSYPFVVAAIAQLETACAQRLAALAQAEADIQARQHLQQATRMLPLEPERLSRYERHIVRTLNLALDRLQALRHQRQNQPAIGSFG